MNEQIVLGAFLVALDLGGTFVFALSGAAAGIRRRLDIFGVLVLSFVAANFGGITRDVLIGATPPVAIQDWRYVAVSILAGLIAFFWYPLIERLRSPVLVFDAIGLALFATVGTAKALTFHLGPVASALLGMLSGIGGGLVRDILISEVPAVFRAEIYAVAALAGAAVVVLGHLLQVPAGAAAMLGATLCFTLRMISIRRGWKLPIANPSAPEES
ncbi:MAG TPA: trimeric intracellular cation channel family protein [Bryobacteraceae bacterium]|nr:trimeric intracellular cation channel family protein [Bryobacteraceae bacterium]